MTLGELSFGGLMIVQCQDQGGTPCTGRVELRLLSSFELHREDRPMAVPQSAERLLAFLALHDRPLSRMYVAGRLWPEATDAHSHGSLRSALWRVHSAVGHVVDPSGTRLRLAPHVRVDLREGLRVAGSLLEPGPDRPPVWTAAVAVLDTDLLPDWYTDEWLDLPREQWRQTRLHAMEALALRLADEGAHAAAVTVALAAVRGEPLRESAHRCLARVHLAEGNVGEALSTYRRFRELLGGELGVAPSPQFVALVNDIEAPALPEQMPAFQRSVATA